MSEPNVVRVYRTFAGGGRGLLGNAVRGREGWRFLPNVFGKAPSRKRWPTWEACLPRWVAYPNGCQTEIVREERADEQVQ